MNVASLELCKELYELSGWDDTHAFYYEHYDGIALKFNDQGAYNGQVESFSRDAWNTPAYDLGYLLRKMPAKKYEHLTSNLKMIKHGKNSYEFTYFKLSASADTPENAAAKLAIELFKQGLLTKDQN